MNNKQRVVAGGELASCSSPDNIIRCHHGGGKVSRSPRKSCENEDVNKVGTFSP